MNWHRRSRRARLYDWLYWHDVGYRLVLCGLLVVIAIEISAR